MTRQMSVNPKKLRPYDEPPKRRRSLIPDGPDTAATGFLVAAALWLAVATGLGVLAIALRIIPFEGIVLAAEKYDDPEPVNLGTGQEITIRELVNLVVELTGYQGEIRWDATKPDGQPRRALDMSRARARIGFEAHTSFEDGLRVTIAAYDHAPAGVHR